MNVWKASNTSRWIYSASISEICEGRFSVMVDSVQLGTQNLGTFKTLALAKRAYSRECAAEHGRVKWTLCNEKVS